MNRSAGNAQKHETSNPLQRMLIERFHRGVATLIRTVDPASILDLGCGEGYVLDALTNLGIDATLTGVDMSEEAVAAARIRLEGRAEILHGDIRDLRVDLEPFDLAMMLEVLEHLEEPADGLELLASMSRGPIIVSVPWEPFFRGLNLLRLKNVRRFGSDPEHVQHWTRRSFRRFVGDRFDIVESQRAFPWTLLLLEPRSGPPASPA